MLLGAAEALLTDRGDDASIHEQGGSPIVADVQTQSDRHGGVSRTWLGTADVV